MAKPNEERRTGKPLRFYLVERRKGKLWKYASIVICIALVGYLVRLLLR